MDSTRSCQSGRQASSCTPSKAPPCAGRSARRPTSVRAFAQWRLWLSESGPVLFEPIDSSHAKPRSHLVHMAALPTKPSMSSADAASSRT